MNTKSQWILLFFTSIFLSCSENLDRSYSTYSIDLEDSQSDNLPGLEVNSIIPLGGDEDTVIFGDYFLIEYVFDRIYILDFLDAKSLFAFSNKGNFVKKTINGKGPGESIRPSDFCINHNDGSILVWDQILRTIYEYDQDLNFLTQFRIEAHVQNLAMLNNYDFLVYTHYEQDFAFKLHSPSFGSLKDKFVKDIKYSGAVDLFRPIAVNKNKVFLISPFEYKIFEYKDEHVDIFMELNLGEYALSKEYVMLNGASNSYKLIRGGEKASGPTELSVGNDLLLFHIFSNYESVHFIYSFKENTIHNLNNYFNIGKLPKCRIRGIIENDIIYATVAPNDLIEFQEETGSVLYEGEIREDQNPFLLTFKLSL